MSRADVSGLLLVGSFVLWFPVAALPSRVWSASLEERLALIAAGRRAWRIGNAAIAASAVALVLGFVLLADLLETAGAGIIVSLSLAVLLIGAPLWLASLTFRLTAMVAVEGRPPPAFAAVSAWAGGLFLSWSILANAAVIGFGSGILRSGYPAAWCGWVAIVLGSLMLVQLVLTGDALPALYHLGPLFVGVALLAD